MAVVTATPTGGTWSVAATWDTATVPTAADDVVFDAASGPVTIAAAAVARSVNASAYVNTLTHNAAVTLSLGDATAGAGSAALTLGTGMTYTIGSGTTSAVSFVSTSTTQQTVTMAGKTAGNLTFAGLAGTWRLTDTVTCGAVAVTSGALATGNQTITCTTMTITGASASAALGTSVINLTSTATASVFIRASSAVFTAGAATINITTTSANVRTVAPQATNLNLATVNYTVAGSTGTLQFLGLTNIGTLNVSDATNARTVQFGTGSVYTFGTFNVQGASGRVVTLQSSASGTAVTMSKTSGVVSCDYLSLKDLAASGGASWYAGANSVIVSNVTGWMLTAPSNYQFFAF